MGEMADVSLDERLDEFFYDEDHEDEMEKQDY